MSKNNTGAIMLRTAGEIKWKSIAVRFKSRLDFERRENESLRKQLESAQSERDAALAIIKKAQDQEAHHYIINGKTIAYPNPIYDYSKDFDAKPFYALPPIPADHSEDVRGMVWQPIEIFPDNNKSDYSFCVAAWGTDEDKSTGHALRYKNQWFAGALFYKGGLADTCQFKFEHIPIQPSHFIEIPEFNQSEVK